MGFVPESSPVFNLFIDPFYLDCIEMDLNAEELEYYSTCSRDGRSMILLNPDHGKNIKTITEPEALYEIERLWGKKIRYWSRAGYDRLRRRINEI